MAGNDISTKYSYYVSWSAEDKEFAVSFIELPGLSGLGATIPDAIAQLREAFSGWLELAAEHKYELPEPVQRNALAPLLIINRSHLGQHPLVTEFTVVLPKEFLPAPPSDASTSGNTSEIIEIRQSAKVRQ